MSVSQCVVMVKLHMYLQVLVTKKKWYLKMELLLRVCLDRQKGGDQDFYMENDFHKKQHDRTHKLYLLQDQDIYIHDTPSYNQ